MPNQDKLLENKAAFREALSQALGINLADEIASDLLDGKNLSLEQLAKDHTLTEIGTALIRLDALRTRRAEESCECYRIILGIKFCYTCTAKPPDED